MTHANTAILHPGYLSQSTSRLLMMGGLLFALFLTFQLIRTDTVGLDEVRKMPSYRQCSLNNSLHYSNIFNIFSTFLMSLLVWELSFRVSFDDMTIVFAFLQRFLPFYYHCRSTCVNIFRYQLSFLYCSDTFQHCANILYMASCLGAVIS